MWLAGTFFGDGLAPAQVYAGSNGVFTMEPPRLWIDHVLDQGLETPVYPFIYPPLWAWVAAQLVPLAPFETAKAVATAVNLALLMSMPLLAMRIAKPRISGTAFLLLSFPLFAFTFPFLLPLEENQPQILVSFLVLLGVERARSGAPVVGGMAMAVAASIKLYPVIFALLWLLGGERRATVSFALAGGALGGLSIAVAGWPMHAAFLNEIAAISRSALYSAASYSFDPLIAKLAFPNELVRFTTTETGGESHWKVMVKTPEWRMLSIGLFASALTLLGWIARKTGMSSPFFWPAAFLLVALVSPLTWVYHLIPALVFIPALFGRFAGLPILVLYMIFVVLMRTGSILTHFDLHFASPGSQEILFAALLLLAGLYLLLATERSDRPLRTATQSL